MRVNQYYQIRLDIAKDIMKWAQCAPTLDQKNSAFCFNKYRILRQRQSSLFFNNDYPAVHHFHVVKSNQDQLPHLLENEK
jgi:hypothetical protein